jgi:hypothetical protein
MDLQNQNPMPQQNPNSFPQSPMPNQNPMAGRPMDVGSMPPSNSYPNQNIGLDMGGSPVHNNSEAPGKKGGGMLSSIITALITLILVGVLGYAGYTFILKKDADNLQDQVNTLKNQVSLIQNKISTNNASSTSTTTSSYKDTTYNSFKSLTTWQIEDPVKTLPTKKCNDGSDRATGSLVYGISYESATPTTDDLTALHQKVLTALQTGGWKLCTTDLADAYPKGPASDQVYIKDSKLLYLQASHATGTTPYIKVQFEYPK